MTTKFKRANSLPVCKGVRLCAINDRTKGENKYPLPWGR
jgi:hypothetical protein